MKKEAETKVKKTETYCDVCGKVIKWDLQCSVSRCEYCGKDLCEKCIAKERFTDGDYREVYCEDCWKIAESYYKKIANLEDKIDVLYAECQAKCCI